MQLETLGASKPPPRHAI